MSGVLQAVCTVLPIFGCGPKDVMMPIPQTPAYVGDVSAAKARIDVTAAEKLINDYRMRNGLGRVKLESSLMRIAQTQADAMAAQDRMSHDLPGLGGLKDRLRAGGYRSTVAAENLGAGYRTLGAAFVGWRESRRVGAGLSKPLAASLTRMTADVVDKSAVRKALSAAGRLDLGEARMAVQSAVRPEPRGG